MNPAPYIEQNGERTCGAACLSMVYQSFGSSVHQDEIWKNIAKRNSRGSLASTSHLMAKDAIDRGFEAVVFQATRPLHTLRVCLDTGVTAILNHRLSATSADGHYSVLVGIEQSGVFLHDPSNGPDRRIEFEELLDLWRPSPSRSETIGNVLIAVRPKSEARPEACAECRLEIPLTIACPKCAAEVALRPARALGCIAESCKGRLWRYLCCPQCDCTWNFHGLPSTDTTKPAGAAPERTFDPHDVDSIYKEFDKHLGKLKDIPETYDHVEVQKQLDYIYAQKEPLRVAIAEAAANRKLRQEQMDQLVESGKTNQEVLKKRADEAARQSPPLDGDELGVALLRNLGFVK